jgi:hypothetical protein
VYRAGPATAEAGAIKAPEIARLNSTGIVAGCIALLVLFFTLASHPTS